MNKTKNPNRETPEEFQKRIDKELGYKFDYVMKKMRGEVERLRLHIAIREYVKLLDGVQRFDHYFRLYYWQAAVAIFDYLRQSDALGRQSEGFNEHVKKTISDTLTKAYHHARDVQN